MKNIIKNYFENGKKLPFIVRRENWPDVYGMLITSVRPKKTESGWYGDVYGYPLPPLDESEANEYWGITGKAEKVKNAGSYQWILIKDIPLRWQNYLENSQS